MQDILQKVSYLKGLADGSKINTESDEGKLLLETIKVLEEMALVIDNLNYRQELIVEDLEDFDYDLADLEGYVYDLYDDGFDDFDFDDFDFDEFEDNYIEPNEEFDFDEFDEDEDVEEIEDYEEIDS